MRSRAVWSVVVFGAALTVAISAFAPIGPAVAVARPAGPIPFFPAPAGFPKPVAPPKDAPIPPPLDWLTAARTTGLAVTAERGALEQLTDAKATLTRAKHAVEGARQRLAGLDAHVSVEHDTLAHLDRVRAKVVARQRARAVNVYMTAGGAATALDSMLSAPTVVDGRRSVYAEAAQTVDGDTIDKVDADHRAEQRRLASLEAQQRDARAAVVDANQKLGHAFAAFAELDAAVNDATHGGRVFPVQGKYEFDDSWGFYRAFVYAGTTSHGHHATDVMAPFGTPIVAIESGTLDRVGWNSLGGWRLWIRGVSGTKYYYAHMSAYAPGLKQGTPVRAGQYLGRVGNTGDAQGGPTHLHIEVHVTTPPDFRAADPNKDGWAVNPYPLLCLLAGAPIPPIPPSDGPEPVTTTTTTATTTTSTTTTVP